MFVVKVFNSKGRKMREHRRLSTDAEAAALAIKETTAPGQMKWEAVYEFMGKHVATYKGGVVVQRTP